MTQVDAVIDQRNQEVGGASLKNKEFGHTQHLEAIATPVHENMNTTSTPNDESNNFDEMKDEQGNTSALSSSIGIEQSIDDVVLEKVSGVCGNEIGVAHSGALENDLVDKSLSGLDPGLVAPADLNALLPQKNEALMPTNDCADDEETSSVVATLELTQEKPLEPDHLYDHNKINLEHSSPELESNESTASEPSQLDHLNENDTLDEESKGPIECTTLEVTQEPLNPHQLKENSDDKLKCMPPDTVESPQQPSLEVVLQEQLESDHVNENEMEDSAAKTGDPTLEIAEKEDNATDNVSDQEDSIPISTDIVCPPAPQDGLPMLTRALDAFVQVMTLNGYSFFEEVLLTLGQTSQEYNHIGCEHFGSITTSVLNGKTAYENAARVVYEWCSLTIPLLRGYQRIFLAKTSSQAQWKLLWNIATQATIKLHFAQDQLGYCQIYLGETLARLQDLRENGITKPLAPTESLFSTEEDVEQNTVMPEKWSLKSFLRPKKNKQKRAQSPAAKPVVADTALITPTLKSGQANEETKATITLILQRIQQAIENLNCGRECIVNQVSALEDCIKSQTGVYDYESSSQLLAACSAYISYQ